MNNFKIGFALIGQLPMSDFVSAFNIICSQVEEGEHDVEFVKEAFEKANSHRTALKSIKNRRVPHAKTAKLDSLKKLRKGYLSSMKGKIKSSLVCPIEKEREAAVILNAWLRGLENLKKRAPIHEPTNLIDTMMDELQKNEEIQSAISDAGLVTWTDALTSVNTQIKTTYMERLNDRQRTKSMMESLRKDAYADLKTLFYAIEAAARGKGEDAEMYRLFVFQINETIDVFRAKQNAKAAVRKRAEEKAKAEGEKDGAGDGDNVIVDPVPEMTSMRTFNGGSLNGVELQQAKRAATVGSGISVNMSDSLGGSEALVESNKMQEAEKSSKRSAIIDKENDLNSAG